MTDNAKPSSPAARLPLALKLIYTAFLAVLVPVYWVKYGPTNFLYFCDLALFLTLAGIWTENRLLISLPTVGILLPQVMWCLDFAVQATGHRFTGMTAYMFDSHKSLFLRGLSLFHGWLPFLLMFLVRRLGYDRRALPIWTALAWTACLVSYFFLPGPSPENAAGTAPCNVNYVWGFDDAAAQTWLPSPIYLVAWMGVLLVAIYLPTHWVLSKLTPPRRQIGSMNHLQTPPPESRISQTFRGEPNSQRSGSGVRLLVLSDIHWAGPAEQARAGHEARAVGNPVLRMIARLWRRWVWLAMPHAHNHRLSAILKQAGVADRVLANGDFTLDTGFIGVSDEAAFASSAECLHLLRSEFGHRLLTTIGDHDIGKMSLFGGAGGLRRRSLERCESELGLKRFWRESPTPDWVLIGITSTLAAWPMFAPETPTEERAWWQQQHHAHLAQIAAAFARVSADQKIILCCHDPSALAFLYDLPDVRSRLGQVKATVIGHLHSSLVFTIARALAGCPRVSGCGVTARRYTTALRRARCWKEFRIQLCPSPPGIQLLKDGGWLTIDLHTGNDACQGVQHRLDWHSSAL